MIVALERCSFSSLWNGCLFANRTSQVIKVEAPSGDMLRDLLLHFDGQDKPEKRPHSAFFENFNFDKVSVQLELKTPQHMVGGAFFGNILV